MAAFEGTADPRRAIESGYYVSEPKNSVARTISGRFDLRPSSTHLLIGGIGSGKTTQLLVMCDRINEIEDTYACYIDVSLYTDISQISTGVLIAIAGLELAKLIEESDDEDIKKYIKFIDELAYGYDEEQTIQVDTTTKTIYKTQIPSTIIDIPETINSLRTSIKHYEGALTKKSESDFVKAVGQISKAASEKYGEIILLFDGLDRLNDAQIFSQLITYDVQTISRAGVGVIIVGSLLASYSNHRDTIEQTTNYLYHQSCFDISNDTEAYIFFENILKARASEDFIEQPAVDTLIHYSGGVVRDLINLTQASIEEAYLSDSDKLRQVHVEAAVESFGRAQVLGVSDTELEILKQVSTKHAFIPRTDEDIRLLGTRRILDYTYPNRRYAVHPTIEPLIEKM
ncbi:MAG: hypothetical protein F6K58_25225 [Symploca sp. SIO2E9]|nr:hypothetical protein [Symploca sp. SIO2E9]